MEIQYIASRSNGTVLKAASLKEKKYRDEHGLFLAEGWKLFAEAVYSRLPIVSLLIVESKKDAYLDRAQKMLLEAKMEKVSIFVLAEPCFSKISSEKAPQGVIAVIKHLDFFEESIKINMKDISKDAHALCLCSVRDPGNLGAIVRSAVAFGTDTLILSSDCADVYNPKTLRAAMGSLFKLRIFTVEDLESSIRTLREGGRRVYAAELTDHAVSVKTLDLREDDVFVIGNEGHGIPAEISASCTCSAYIPIVSGVESLNASVAASVLLWELGKSRL